MALGAAYTIVREPCSDSATGMSGVMPTAPQRAETAHLTDDCFRLLGRRSRRECFGDDAYATIPREAAVSATIAHGWGTSVATVRCAANRRCLWSPWLRPALPRRVYSRSSAAIRMYV
jgi:hypothetical protein